MRVRWSKASIDIIDRRRPNIAVKIISHRAASMKRKAKDQADNAIKRFVGDLSKCQLQVGIHSWPFHIAAMK